MGKSNQAISLGVYSRLHSLPRAFDLERAARFLFNNRENGQVREIIQRTVCDSK